jgi:hypothetical protein
MTKHELHQTRTLMTSLTFDKHIPIGKSLMHHGGEGLL